MSHSPEELEGAQISHSLALILSAAAEPHHNGEFIRRHMLRMSSTPKGLIQILISHCLPIYSLRWCHGNQTYNSLIEDMSKFSHVSVIHPCQLSQGKCMLHGSYVKLETKTVKGISVEKSRN